MQIWLTHISRWWFCSDLSSDSPDGWKLEARLYEEVLVLRCLVFFVWVKAWTQMPQLLWFSAKWHRILLIKLRLWYVAWQLVLEWKEVVVRRSNPTLKMMTLNKLLSNCNLHQLRGMRVQQKKQSGRGIRKGSLQALMLPWKLEQRVFTWSPEGWLPEYIVSHVSLLAEIVINSWWKTLVDALLREISPCVFGDAWIRFKRRRNTWRCLLVRSLPWEDNIKLDAAYHTS